MKALSSHSHLPWAGRQNSSALLWVGVSQLCCVSPALVPSSEPPSPCVGDEPCGLGSQGKGRRGCGTRPRALLGDGGTVSARESCCINRGHGVPKPPTSHPGIRPWSHEHSPALGVCPCGYWAPLSSQGQSVALGVGDGKAKAVSRPGIVM